MSAVEASRRPPEGSWGQRLVFWLPALVLIVAAAGVVAVLPSVSSDEGSRAWYRGRLGGSELYELNVIFARLVPFLAGGFIALALLQRRLLPSREAQDTASIQRHTLTEVVTHWLNAAGMGLCLVTAVFLLGWTGNPLSLETAYAVHLIGAGFVLAAVAHHLTYQIVGGGGGLIPTSRSDLKSAFAESVSYAGVYRGVRGVFGVQLPLAVRRPFQGLLRRFNIVPEPAGKFLATEKVLSYPGWAVLIGIVLVTGVVKALHYIYALPGWLRDAMTFLHDGATIFIIVFLVLHVGALILVPRNWPLVRSMLTTRVPRRYAEQHLPRWAPGESRRPDATDDS
jgi:cytochrome b subunit of formate dehydrogenase